MGKKQDVYVSLQRHLNRQPIGFPATKSGAELRILKHIFTPEEAEIATCLSFRPEPLETIFARAEKIVESIEDLERRLTAIGKKGGLEIKYKMGERHFCNAPYVVGMYEFQVNRLTPAFLKDSHDYHSDFKFGLEILSAYPPQMRTIPIAKSIRPQQHVSTFDEVSTLLEEADPPFAIFDCICRKKNALEGKPCQVTDRRETCLAVGNGARFLLDNEIGREISLSETLTIIAQNQKQGLVLQPSNSQKVEFICSCCGCCCGMLGLQKRLPTPVNFWVSNYFAAVDHDLCNGCGNCEKRCQVGAISVSATSQIAAVDSHRCIGCGLCVPTCPQNAVSLEKKSTETQPPMTREELFEVIKNNKKGKLKKLGLAGTLILDAIRSGQAHLLKP